MSDWRSRGRCSTEDLNLFFADEEDYAAERAAKAICTECRIRERCLEQAIADREKDGIWGGFTAAERRRIVRRRRRQQAA